MKKRILGMAAVFGLALGISLVPAKSVKAFDYTDEPAVYDVNYANDNPGKDGDTYRLIVPSDGTITFHASNTPSGVYIYTKDEYGVEHTVYFKENYFGLEPINVEEGEYYVNLYDWTSDKRYTGYNIAFSYEFNTSTTAKISSPAPGKIKVTAPKGGRVDGFEVRYKKKGDKNWTTKTVKTTKTLNETFSGLAKKSTYSVQTRKYVTDTYGYTYYSDWTEVQTVKTK